MSSSWKHPAEEETSETLLLAGTRLAALDEIDNNRPIRVQAAKRLFTRFFGCFFVFISTQFQGGQRDHRAQHAQDVKPDDNLAFVPAFFLKMMMQRRH